MRKLGHILYPFVNTLVYTKYVYGFRFLAWLFVPTQEQTETTQDGSVLIIPEGTR
jgi:hypothetical protein